MNLLKIAKSVLHSAPRVKPAECGNRVRAGDAWLLDVREPAEWAEGVAEHAVPLSFKDLMGERKQWAPFLAGVGDRELLMYCAAGMRAAIAARVLAGEGFHTANTGSLSNWARSGWKIVKPDDGAMPAAH
jgi:rhodanese-related sulfurtransferase